MVSVSRCIITGMESADPPGLRAHPLKKKRRRRRGGGGRAREEEEAKGENVDSNSTAEPLHPPRIEEPRIEDC